MPNIDDLLHKEMTRRQFLVTIGMSFAGLFGISALMGILSGNTGDADKSGAPGYGMRDYGP